MAAARPAKQVDDSTYAGRFALGLKKLREKAGLTVEGLAAELNSNGFTVAPRTLYAWESGRNEPPLNAFPALATSLKLKRIRDLLPTE